MKLVEILARELEKWPEKAAKLTQDDSTAVFGWEDKKHNPVCSGSGYWYSCNGVNCGMIDCVEIDISGAEDRRTAIVTRADWEAERVKLKAHKANGGGWVRHRGGKCPVEAGVLIEVRLRDGESITELSDLFTWNHRKEDGDIMAYRIHKPAEQPCPVETKAAERKCEGRNCKMPTAENHSKECLLDAAIAQGWAGPLEWRDRIRELDTQREEVESAYQRQISEITQERESLVQKLAGEGLALVEVLVQPVEDMSDYRKWREGDLLTLVSGHISDNDFTSGNQYKFLRVDEWDEIVVIDDAGDENGYGVNSGVFKWHSRPAR